MGHVGIDSNFMNPIKYNVYDFNDHVMPVDCHSIVYKKSMIIEDDQLCSYCKLIKTFKFH